MPRTTPLPRELFGTSIRTSDSVDVGLSRERLRSRDVDHPFHGMSSVGLDLGSVVGLCRAFEPLLRPGQFFSHTTAALLHGIPLPASVGLLPLHLSAVGVGARPRRANVVGHLFASIDVSLACGLPVVAPAATWFQLAAELNAPELVAAGDYLVSGTRMFGGQRSPALCSREQLAAVVANNAGNRGAKRAGWSLPKVREGVDSPRESLLRLVLVAGGLPEPLIGLAVIVDEGRLVLHPDLAWPEWRVLLEYEGERHRTDRARFQADIRRRELFEAANWRVIRVTSADLTADPAPFLSRVRAILRLRAREKAKMGASWLR